MMSTVSKVVRLCVNTACNSVVALVQITGDAPSQSRRNKTALLGIQLEQMKVKETYFQSTFYHYPPYNN